MSAFDVINLSQLPAPEVVETLDYEAILAEMTGKLTELAPELAPVLALESEPAVKILEVCAYRELLLRQRVNDAARSVMLAFATGSNLDQLAALFGVSRLVLDEGDAEASPPIAPTYEADDDFRVRVQLALEGFSTAGPVGAYTFHALSADPDVRDVAIDSPTPGTVRVTVLSRQGDGTADTALLNTVSAALNADDVRPLCDSVVVQGATIVDFAVTAELELQDGPDTSVVLAEAQAAVQDYVEGAFKLGRDVSLSGLYAALHRPGVVRVTLTSPAADVAIAPTEAGHCTAITVTEAA